MAGAALTCAGRYSITGSDRDSVDQSNCSVLDFVMWRLDYEALSCADGMCAYFSRSFLTLPTPRGGLVSMILGTCVRVVIGSGPGEVFGLK